MFAHAAVHILCLREIDTHAILIAVNVEPCLYGNKIYTCILACIARIKYLIALCHRGFARQTEICVYRNIPPRSIIYALIHFAVSNNFFSVRLLIILYFCDSMKHSVYFILSSCMLDVSAIVDSCKL